MAANSATNQMAKAVRNGVVAPNTCHRDSCQLSDKCLAPCSVLSSGLQTAVILVTTACQHDVAIKRNHVPGTANPSEDIRRSVAPAMVQWVQRVRLLDRTHRVSALCPPAGRYLSADLAPEKRALSKFSRQRRYLLNCRKSSSRDPRLPWTASTFSVLELRSRLLRCDCRSRECRRT